MNKEKKIFMTKKLMLAVLIGSTLTILYLILVESKIAPLSGWRSPLLLVVIGILIGLMARNIISGVSAGFLAGLIAAIVFGGIGLIISFGDRSKILGESSPASQTVIGILELAFLLIILEGIGGIIGGGLASVGKADKK